MFIGVKNFQSCFNFNLVIFVRYDEQLIHKGITQLELTLITLAEFGERERERERERESEC